MPTVLACLRRSVERMWPPRVPTRFAPGTRLRRPKNQWNQGPLATPQAEMCPRTANSGPTLAGFVGEAVTVRCDPRDLSEIRLFHRGGFLCRAVNEEHAGKVVTLKDIEAARRAHRRALRAAIDGRAAQGAGFLPPHDQQSRPAAPPRPASSPARRLRLYAEDEP